MMGLGEPLDTCESCGTLILIVTAAARRAHQDQLPYPEHVACSDICNILAATRKPVPA